MIASYFDLSTVNRGNSRKSRLQNHKTAVLEVINSGSMKELQVLPSIGLKTAYQIVTHRVLNGKFKTITDLKGLACLKGKLWDKFLKVNTFYETLLQLTNY